MDLSASVLTGLALTAVLTVVLAGRDTPNAIALAVRHRALTPGWALALAAGMRVIGVFLGASIAGLMILDFQRLIPAEPDAIIPLIVGVCSAILWGIYTWIRGVPVSTSHAMIAALTGGMIALYLLGLFPAQWGDVGVILGFIVIATLVSPVIAGVLSWLISWPVLRAFGAASTHLVKVPSRMILAVSAAANALGHGVQYGQRIYVLTGMILATATPVPHVSGVALTVAIAGCMAAGTLLGGWRIGYTLTERLTVLDPLRAAMASLSSGLILIGGTALFQLPLSSTLATSGSIMGAGAVRGVQHVRWHEALRLASYYVMTLPVGLIFGFIGTVAAVWLL